MKQYFDAQMALLNETASKFAEIYPEEARALNITDTKNRDPHIERLLEGVAYLTGQIQKQLDDDLPELTEGLLTQFAPQLIKPFPSCTIMQFTPRVGQLQKTTLLEKGAKTLSDPVGEERVNCCFTTTSDVVLTTVKHSTPSHPTVIIKKA